MTLTPEEQALLDARREMLRAGREMDRVYAEIRDRIATDQDPETPEDPFRALGRAADAYDVACRAYDAAFRAAYDRSRP